MLSIAVLQKLLFFLAVIFMGIGFYTALGAAYQSDVDFGEEYPKDRWKTTFCWVMIILGFVCLIASVGLLVYRILLDLNLI